MFQERKEIQMVTIDEKMNKYRYCDIKVRAQAQQS